MLTPVSVLAAAILFPRSDFIAIVSTRRATVGASAAIARRRRDGLRSRFTGRWGFVLTAAAADDGQDEARDEAARPQAQ
ncbi:MAG: hypothetical protein OEV65_15710 [Aquincola sp.]|nr:hypothetical protein [Aquincola sp.]